MESSMNLEPLRWQLPSLCRHPRINLPLDRRAKMFIGLSSKVRLEVSPWSKFCWQKFSRKKSKEMLLFFFVLRSLNKNGQKDGSGTKRKRKLTCISGSGHWHTLNRSTPLSQPKHLSTPSKVGPELGTDGNWLNQRFEPLQLAFKKQVFGQLAVIQRFQIER